MEKPLLPSVNKEEFDKVMQLIVHIGDHEKHFNNLEADYRRLSSTWLLASLGACGFILKAETTMPFDKWYMVFGISVAASIGISILWMLDIKVYHRLLHSFFTEGVRLEMENLWLNPIRINMVRSQETGNVVAKVQYYYFVSIILLLLLATIAVWNFGRNAVAEEVKFLITGGIFLTIGFIFFKILKKPDRITEVKRLIQEYEKRIPR